MIQRAQSVYLLLGAACALAPLYLRVPSSGVAAEEYAWLPVAILAVGCVAAAISLVAVFLYANRTRQRTVAGLVQILLLVELALLFGWIFLSNVVPTAADVRGIGVLFLPAAAYVLVWLARRSIQSDIDLVKSMDRLR